MSGDVHVAAWGVVYRKDVEPADNWAQIQQLTSTAVVHPSLVSVMERLFFHVLNSVAGSAQTLDVNLSAEMMLFLLEPLRDGGPQLAGAGTGRRRGQAVGELALRDQGILHQPSAGDRSGQGPGLGQRGGPVASRDFRRRLSGRREVPAVALVAPGMSPAVAAAIIAAKAAGGRGG